MLAVGFLNNFFKILALSPEISLYKLTIKKQKQTIFRL